LRIQSFPIHFSTQVAAYVRTAVVNWLISFPGNWYRVDSRSEGREPGAISGSIRPWRDPRRM